MEKTGGYGGRVVRSKSMKASGSHEEIMCRSLTQPESARYSCAQTQDLKQTLIGKSPSSLVGVGASGQHRTAVPKRSRHSFQAVHDNACDRVVAIETDGLQDLFPFRGCLIGKGGENVRFILQQTGVHIAFGGRSEQGLEARLSCRRKGANLTEAIAYLDDLVADSWKEIKAKRPRRTRQAKAKIKNCNIGESKSASMSSSALAVDDSDQLFDVTPVVPRSWAPTRIPNADQSPGGANSRDLESNYVEQALVRQTREPERKAQRIRKLVAEAQWKTEALDSEWFGDDDDSNTDDYGHWYEDSEDDENFYSDGNTHEFYGALTDDDEKDGAMDHDSDGVESLDESDTPEASEVVEEITQLIGSHSIMRASKSEPWDVKQCFPVHDETDIQSFLGAESGLEELTNAEQLDLISVHLRKRCAKMAPNTSDQSICNYQDSQPSTFHEARIPAMLSSDQAEASIGDLCDHVECNVGCTNPVAQTVCLEGLVIAPKTKLQLFDMLQDTDLDDPTSAAISVTSDVSIPCAGEAHADLSTSSSQITHADSERDDTSVNSKGVLMTAAENRECYVEAPQDVQTKGLSGTPSVEMSLADLVIAPCSSNGILCPTWPATFVPVVSMGHVGLLGFGAWWPQTPVQTAADKVSQEGPIAKSSAVASPTAKSQPLERAFCVDTGAFHVRWHVDGRKFRGDEMRLVSPAFELQLGQSFPSAVFKMILVPKISWGHHCFRRSRGLGCIKIKCESNLGDDVSLVSFRILVGEGASATSEVWSHDFSKSAVFEAPDVWDFREAVSSQATNCRICLEVLSSGSRSPQLSNSISDSDVENVNVIVSIAEKDPEDTTESHVYGPIDEHSEGKWFGELNAPELLKDAEPERAMSLSAQGSDSQSTSAASDDEGTPQEAGIDESPSGVSSFYTLDATFRMEPASPCIFLSDGAGLLSSNLQWRLPDRQPSCVYNANRSICPYYLRGCCKFGTDCRGYHPPSFQAVDASSASNRACRLPAASCRVCGTITDPPHWGNECPWNCVEAFYIPSA